MKYKPHWERFPLFVKVLKGCEEARGGEEKRLQAFFLSPRKNQYNLYFNLKLSAIMAMNSEFVGLPRLFCIV